MPFAPSSGGVLLSGVLFLPCTLPSDDVDGCTHCLGSPSFWSKGPAIRLPFICPVSLLSIVMGSVSSHCGNGVDEEDGMLRHSCGWSLRRGCVFAGWSVLPCLLLVLVVASS